jgi:pimeloyl-ACP methyl ester carboxylesterase
MMKLAFTVFAAIIFFCSNSYAEMPSVSCESKCPTVSAGAHCAQLNKNRIYYRTLGKGQPTIIFSSGTGFPADGWYEAGIANKIAEKANVFSYDRNFTFNSCPNPNNYMPITAQDVVTELRQLLKQENIKSPYILVGHSFGGLYMLLYAREFPNEVAGLVLMDATSDAGPTPMPKAAEKILQRLGNPQNATPDNPLYNEMIGQLPSYLQMKNAPPLAKDMPLIVMYATKHCLPSAWTKKLMCMTPAQEATHLKGQMDMYNMSRVHRLIRMDGGHLSFFTRDQNPIVMQALYSILDMTKSR